MRKFFTCPSNQITHPRGVEFSKAALILDSHCFFFQCSVLFPCIKLPLILCFSFTGRLLIFMMPFSQCGTYITLSLGLQAPPSESVTMTQRGQIAKEGAWDFLSEWDIIIVFIFSSIDLELICFKACVFFFSASGLNTGGRCWWTKIHRPSPTSPPLPCPG